MDNIRTINGDLVARDLRFAIVASRFNDFIVDSLIRGAVDTLLRHGAGEKQVEIIRVPGAYDLPFVVRRVAVSKRYDAIVAARFNDMIVDSLIRGAVDALLRHGATEKQIEIIRVPGAYDLPFVVRRVAASKRYDAVVALGAVIRGATPHFDHVAGQCAAGLARAADDTGVPVAFGVLTTDTIEQAIERAGTKAGNKGADAALCALELANLLRRLDV